MKGVTEIDVANIQPEAGGQLPDLTTLTIEELSAIDARLQGLDDLRALVTARSPFALPGALGAGALVPDLTQLSVPDLMALRIEGDGFPEFALPESVYVPKEDGTVAVDFTRLGIEGLTEIGVDGPVVTQFVPMGLGPRALTVNANDAARTGEDKSAENNGQSNRSYGDETFMNSATDTLTGRSNGSNGHTDHGHGGSSADHGVNGAADTMSLSVTLPGTVTLAQESGGSSNSGNNTIYGTSAADNITGGNGNDILYGLDGDDKLHGNNGNDILYGGAGADKLYGNNGDDVLMWSDASDTRLDGGGDQDTLNIDGFSVNLKTFAGTLQSLETLDLGTGAGANSTVTLDASTVLSMSSNKSVTLFGSAGDVANIGAGWTDGGFDGAGNHVYTQAVGPQTATLLVDTDITVNFV